MNTQDNKIETLREALREAIEFIRQTRPDADGLIRKLEIALELTKRSG